MKAAASLLFCQMLAYWPVWVWYGRRMFDGSDEPFGFLALITAGVFVALRVKSSEFRGSTILWSLIGLAAFLLSFGVLPPLLRAVLAIWSVGVGLSDLLCRQKVHVGLIGLLLLSLPIIASLQFYLGYPLRCLSAFFVVALLNACGVSVEQEGINLLWLGEVVVVDAPCSGIRMLWGGLYLAFTLSCFQDLSTRQTLMAYSLAGLTVFLGNIIRTALLFCLEANFLSGPAWLHQGIGMTVFVIVAVLIHQEIKTMKGVRDAFVQV